MGNLVGAPAKVFKAELKVPGKDGTRGTFIVRTEAEAANSDCVLFEYKWANLRNMAGCLCKSAQPFVLEIERSATSGLSASGVNQFIKVDETNPFYRVSEATVRQQLEISKLCNSDP